MRCKSEYLFDISEHVESAVVLELVNQRAPRTFHQNCGAPLPERRHQTLAMRAHPLSVDDAVKRVSTARTMRRFDVIDLDGASTAHMSILAALFNESAAVDAAGREHQINDALESAGQDAHAAGTGDRTLERRPQLLNPIPIIAGILYESAAAPKYPPDADGFWDRKP